MIGILWLCLDVEPVGQRTRFHEAQAPKLNGCKIEVRGATARPDSEAGCPGPPSADLSPNLHWRRHLHYQLLRPRCIASDEGGYLQALVRDDQAASEPSGPAKQNAFHEQKRKSGSLVKTAALPALKLSSDIYSTHWPEASPCHLINMEIMTQRSS